MVRAALLLAVLILMPAPAVAQAQPPQTESSGRPYRGIFGAPPAPSSHRLALSLTLGGGYDNNVLSQDDDFDGAFEPLRGRESATGQVRAQLTYAKQGDRFDLSAMADSNARYYQALTDRFLSQHAGSVTVSGQIASRTRVAATQRLTYEPFYSLWAVGSPITPGLDPALIADPSTQTRLDSRLRLNSNLTLSQQLTRRVSLSLLYGYHRGQSRASGLGLQAHRGALGVSYLVGRGVSLRVGYRYARSELGPPDARIQYEDHTADVGLDFDQALALGRGTTLGFGGGVVGVRDEDRTRYRLAGQVGLNHEIGRTWSASLGYTRNVHYVDSFRVPVLSDSLGVGAGGLLGRRLSVSAGLGVALGNVGFGASANDYRSYYGRTGLTMGLARNVGLGIDYVYSRYRFGGGVALPGGVPSEVNRHGVSVSMQLSPLWSWTGR